MKTLSIIVSVLLLVTGIFLPINQASAATSNFSMSGVSTPSNLYIGSGFAVKGKVFSRAKLNYVKVGITNSSGKWLTGEYARARPNATYYDISKFDSKIKFGALKPGTYHYKVWVRDIYNKSKLLVNKAFTVTAMKTSGVNSPGHRYFKANFKIKGKIMSKYKISCLRAGIMNSSKTWISGMNKTVRPLTTIYDLSNLNSSVLISNLSPGTYYYCVRAMSSKEGSKALILKQFTVSRYASKNITKPTSIKSGSSFNLSGKIYSVFKMKSVRIGVKNSSNSWISGKYKTVNPNATNYNVAGVDSSISFGSLSSGTYYYCVWARDSQGVSNTIIKQKFTVTGSNSSSNSSASVAANGKILSYSKSLIGSTIGAQKVSGPCGIYAMAYARAVIDKSFTKAGYSSVYSRLINQYGFGTYCAYWSQAGGDSCYYSTASSCYRAALAQVCKGKPAIINVYNGNTGNQHYLTVIGYVKGTTTSNVSLSKFIVLDPGYGCIKYLSQMNYYNNSSPQCITF